MGNLRLSSEMHSAINKLSRDKTISQPEQQALGMLMMPDCLDVQEQQEFDATPWPTKSPSASRTEPAPRSGMRK